MRHLYSGTGRVGGQPEIQHVGQRIKGYDRYSLFLSQTDYSAIERRLVNSDRSRDSLY
jgi:hypothetical protein